MIFDAVSKMRVLFPFKSIFIFSFFVFIIYLIFLFWLAFLIKVCVFSSISVSYGTFYSLFFMHILNFEVLELFSYPWPFMHFTRVHFLYSQSLGKEPNSRQSAIQAAIQPTDNAQCGSPSNRIKLNKSKTRRNPK